MISVNNNQKVQRFRSAILLCVSAFVLIVPIGCQGWLPFANKARHIEPALSMSIGRDALVDNLNRHSAGLNGWQCLSTRLRVKMSPYPATTLMGVIACKSPNYFRLKADNPFAKADLGSNASKCWAYVKPGEPAVLTWDHEDTELIQQLSLEVPYIDPSWLMLVLGITPLDASEYQLGAAPNGKPELWLTAMEQSAQGRNMRRVVKVDTVEGVVREHALYDDANNAVVRAVLTSHRPYAGYLVPGQVRLIFPATKTELTLSFNNIETNPVLPDKLWHMPSNNLQVVDLGMLARQKLMASGQYVAPAQKTAELISHTNEFGRHDSSVSQLSRQENFQQPNATNQMAQEADSFEAFMASEQQSAVAAPDSMGRDRFFVPNNSHETSGSANFSAPDFDSNPDAGTWDSQSFPDEAAPLAAPDWDDPVPKKPSFFGRMMGR
ncbi:MAG: hypothetical protein ABJZ55_17120 [Fuerstiella sp.]